MNTIRSKKKPIMKRLFIIINLLTSITDILGNISANSKDKSEKIDESIVTLKNEITLLETECKQHEENIDEELKALNDKIDDFSKELSEKKLQSWINPKLIKNLLLLVVVLALVTTSWFAFKPNFYRTDFEKLDVNSIDQMIRYDTLFLQNIKKEIDIEYYKYEKFNRLAIDSNKFKQNLIKQIEQRNDSYLKEIEKEHSRLISNVVLINLVGRYTIIIFCIMVLAFMIWGVVKKEDKGDIFE
jgi:hypothetical protein